MCPDVSFRAWCQLSDRDRRDVLRGCVRHDNACTMRGNVANSSRHAARTRGVRSMTNECWDNCERFVVCARVGKRAALYIMLCDKYGRYNVAHVGRLGRGGRTIVCLTRTCVRAVGANMQNAWLS